MEINPAHWAYIEPEAVSPSGKPEQSGALSGLRIVISPTSCREMVPEPELLAQCIRDDFQAYLELARHQARLKAARRRRATLKRRKSSRVGKKRSAAGRRG